MIDLELLVKHIPNAFTRRNGLQVRVKPSHDCVIYFRRSGHTNAMYVEVSIISDSTAPPINNHECRLMVQKFTRVVVPDIHYVRSSICYDQLRDDNNMWMAHGIKKMKPRF